MLLLVLNYLYARSKKQQFKEFDKPEVNEIWEFS